MQLFILFLLHIHYQVIYAFPKYIQVMVPFNLQQRVFYYYLSIYTFLTTMVFLLGLQETFTNINSDCAQQFRKIFLIWKA